MEKVINIHSSGYQSKRDEHRFVIEWMPEGLLFLGVANVILPGLQDDAQQALGRRSRFTITASATKYPTHAKHLQLDFRYNRHSWLQLINPRRVQSGSGLS